MAEQFLKPLHLACSKDETRTNAQLIHIKNNIATASDGHLLVKIDLTKTSSLDPEKLKFLENKHIHMEVWKEIHKCEFLEFDDDHIYCHNNGIKKTFEYSEANGSFFNSEQVIIDIKEAGEEPKRMMRYSPALINTLSKIFQDPHLTFSFSKDNKGTIVYPAPESGMFAVLMPVEILEVHNRYLFI